ncbi:hypothetical protein SAMN05443549_101387 [Flavobacterium fluvii]|uniref:DUF5640 domain-containing protein n=1 Tax=Flavobacterium fluvii TaxID=468056 RepID=A0A1M5ELJ8_9FLAO|nr:hypothetical protein [Flavobacterium fluvii]SHF80014.1 hypothetical protein SAMN05443549_101387 [Flavobacterium fluvii]
MKIKIALTLISIVFLLSFQQKENNSIKGIWTDKTTENATFEIRDKTIYYIDAFATYKYTFKNNIIKIYYSDYTFTGKVSFKNDIMFIKSSDGIIIKYYRFKG